MMATILPPRERLGSNICNDLTEANQREWIISNGLGSYACGTLSGILTRRYHGLLIVGTSHSSQRRLLFSKVESSLLYQGNESPLFSHCGRDGRIDPMGYRYIESFMMDGRMPVWHFLVGGVGIEMRIWLEHGANTCYVAYRLQPDATVGREQYQIKCALLANERCHHALSTGTAFEPHISMHEQKLNVCLAQHKKLYFTAVGGCLEAERKWRRNFLLQEECDADRVCLDQHLCVGQAVLDLTPGKWVGVICSLHAQASCDRRAALNRFRGHDIAILKQAKTQINEFRNAPHWIDRLLLATDSFLVTTHKTDGPPGESVIAGFPCCNELGRDAMIALPGLTLATGRFDKARRILETYSDYIDNGQVPQVLPSPGESAHYKSADTTLWYIEAWRSYLKYTQDLRALHKIYPLLQRIIINHLKGTPAGVIMDPADGLLHCANADNGPTWMVSNSSTEPSICRIGKPVEVNALWFNAINTMTKFAYQLGLNSNPYGDLVKKTLQGFQRFVKAKQAGLYDVLDGPKGHDDSVRPNQILAVSLPYSALDKETMATVVQVCRQELLTSYGLRSLSRRHKNFHPRIKGRKQMLSQTLYQGAVWAWLLGPYALAEYRVHNDPLAAQSRLDAIQDHLQCAALGTIGQVFDGTAPHAAHGSLAQAWSVACTVEAWWKLEKAKKLTAQNRASDIRELQHALRAPS